MGDSIAVCIHCKRTIIIDRATDEWNWHKTPIDWVCVTTTGRPNAAYISHPTEGCEKNGFTVYRCKCAITKDVKMKKRKRDIEKLCDSVDKAIATLECLPPTFYGSIWKETHDLEWNLKAVEKVDASTQTD